MIKMKRIFAVSLIAMFAVASARATIVSQENIEGKNGVNVSVNSTTKKVEIDSVIPTGTSSSAKATVEKVVSIPSVTSLKEGQMIVVIPTTTSTVANSTLKLNSFNAYPMQYKGVAITTSTDSISLFLSKLFMVCTITGLSSNIMNCFGIE